MGQGPCKVPRYKRCGRWGVILSFGDESSVMMEALNKRMGFKSHSQGGDRVRF